MAIGPAYDDLEGLMEATQTEGIRYLDQPPDRRTNLLESDPELVNAKPGLRFVGLLFQLSSPWLSSPSLPVGAGGESQYIAMGQTGPRQLVAEREADSGRP